MNGQLEIVVPSQRVGHEDGVLLEFLDDLYAIDGLKLATAYGYYMVARTLAKYLYKHRLHVEAPVNEVQLPQTLSPSMFASLTESEWDGYLSYYRHVVGEADASYAFRLTVFRKFYNWFSQKHGYSIPVFVMNAKRPSLRAKSITTVSRNELNAILEALTGEFRSRNVAIVLLVVECGLGLDEISDLDLEDLELNHVRIRRFDKKERRLPLPENVKMALDRYVSERIPPIGGGNPLFVSKKGDRMQNRTMQKMLTKAIRKSPHLRKNITFRTLQQTWFYNMAQAAEANLPEYSRSETAWYLQGKYRRLRQESLLPALGGG